MKNTLLVFAGLLIYFNNFSQLKISCTGTSITAGYGIAYSSSYPIQMQGILGSQWSVGNFGVNGSTILHQGDNPYINSANYVNAQSFNPNIVIVEFGANDSKSQNWNNHKDSFVADYTRFVNVFKALPKHPVIYACLPVPALSSMYGINDSIITNAIIPLVKTIAANNNLKLIDLNTPLKNHPEWYQSDKIHPNETGALVLAQIVAKAVSAPSNLTLSVADTRKIKLTWLDNTNETSFTIERSKDSVHWKTLVTLSANTTQYADSGISKTTKYYYRMYAAIAPGNTDYSDVVSAVSDKNSTLKPEIISRDSVSGVIGENFHYTIKALNNPSGFSAANLPAGLTLNAATGKVSGKPLSNAVGTSIATLTATNAYGSNSKALKIIITSSVPVARTRYGIQEAEY